MKDDVRDFLISRRAQITPEQAGISWGGEDRRVPGLRREEVAVLAGVSTDYYTRLERGNLGSASDSVLNALARALQLTDAEREHLFALARTTGSRAHPDDHQPATPLVVRPSVQRVLDGMHMPAIVYNARQDLLATNLLGRAMFDQLFEHEQPNLARFMFIDPRARDFYEDWELACCYTAAMLRLEAGRDPLNPDLTALIGELSTRSPRFRQDWADQHVHEHQTGHKTFRHPVVGELGLNYDVFEFPGEPKLWITTYTAEENSPSAEKLLLLASWDACREPGIEPRAETP